MSTPATPSSPNPAGDDRNLVPVDATTAVSFDEKLEVVWQKNRGLILGVCALILLAIIGKGVWDYLQRQKEADVQKAYVAATTSEQLKAFSAEHGDHPLAGIAQLRVADEAYAAGKSSDAISGYEKAAAILEQGPLTARAKLGRALAKVQSGNKAEGVTELTQLANDPDGFKAIRAEAAYHLTSLAVEAGSAEDAQKFSDQLMQIDPTSPWTQRGLALRTSLPAPAAAPATSAPADAAAKEGEAKSDSGPNVKLNLPGK